MGRSKEEEEGEQLPFTEVTKSRCHSWLCAISQNLVTWSHVAARESEDVASNRVVVCLT